jgi:hypothetical protein
VGAVKLSLPCIISNVENVFCTNLQLRYVHPWGTFVLLLHHAVNHGQAVDSHTVQVSRLMLDVCENYVAGHTNFVCSAVYM